MLIQHGYCHCGCGKKTNIAKRTKSACGHIKGQPLKYIHNHHMKSTFDVPDTVCCINKKCDQYLIYKNNHMSTSGTSKNGSIKFICKSCGNIYMQFYILRRYLTKCKSSHGYHRVHKPNSINNIHKYLHQYIAENVIGKSLPEGAEIHHIDSDKSNNANTNLVLCENHAYHAILHLRSKAIAAGQDPKSIYCSKCSIWKKEDEFYHTDHGLRKYPCRKCRNEYSVRYKRINKEHGSQWSCMEENKL